MSTPGGLSPRYAIPGEVVQPTAMIDPVSEAAHGLGQVLQTLVQRSVGAFHSETDQDAAMTAIGHWVNSQVTPSVRTALAEEGDVRAPKEDVTQRTPPNQVGPSAVQGQTIDYARLAAAIAEHMKGQAGTEVATTQEPSE